MATDDWNARASLISIRHGVAEAEDEGASGEPDKDGFDHAQSARKNSRTPPAKDPRPGAVGPRATRCRADDG